MLTKIKLQPGINRDATNYANSGGWFDSDYIRFRNGLPEKIGGWIRTYENQAPLIGICRKMYEWSSLIGTSYTACPTNIKFYVDNSSSIIDVTPLRRSVTLGANAISTNTASNVTTSFTASISGGILNVTAVSSGTIRINSVITGSGVAGGTKITEFIEGAGGLGGVGLYKLNNHQTVASTSMTSVTTTITITDVNHGVAIGDYVTLSGATNVTNLSTAVVTGSISGATMNVTAVTSGVISVGSLITGAGVSANTVVSSFGTGTGGAGTYFLNNSQTVASTTLTSTLINTEFVVAGVTNSNAYSVVFSGTATSNTTGGGSGIVASYQFHPGVAQTAVFEGWGSGPWGGVSGSYGWGSGPSTSVTTYYSGLWTVDNYGEDMIACPRSVTNGTLIGGSAIATSNLSNTVTVTQSNHGYSNGNAIVISGITSAIGGIPTNQINGTHTITVANANAYTFTVSNTATSTATGTGSNVYSLVSSIVYWDITNSTGPATSLSLLGSAYAKSYLPYVATEVMVSDQNRQVIAFGCNPYDVSQGQDPMIVRWSDSSDPTNWDIADTTKTAGEQRLSSGSYIVTAAQSREEILVWTDTALYSMQYVGPPNGYGFNTVGTNFEIIGPNAKVITGSVSYWMGSNNFFIYDGKIETMPCTVRDYVFADLSIADGDKVYCSSDSGNNEVIWFYPSESQGGEPGSREVDRYVVYNYSENVWYYGSLSRTAWLDRRGGTTPRAVAIDGYLYTHENGFDDGSTEPASPIVAYIQSSPIEIEDGSNFLFINRIIPDLTFRNSTTDSGGAEPIVKFTIKPQNYPGGEIGAGDEGNVQRNSSATLTVNRFTDQLFTRLRARSVALRVESDTTGVAWRLGTPRIDVRQDGRK